MSAAIIALPSKPSLQEGTVYMDAILRPNRSLSRYGFRMVMLSMAAMSFVAGLGFWSIGAWPVIGFFGLDVVLLYLAFKVNFIAGAKECETIRVTATAVEISRTCYRGHTGWWSVSPAFAQIQVDELSEYEAQVHLRAGGTSVPIATCLSPKERLEFAAAFKTALNQARNERYPSASQ